MDLASIVRPPARTLRPGVVDTYPGGSSIVVLLDGAKVAMPCLGAAYAAGDVVQCIREGRGGWTCLPGSFGPAANIQPGTGVDNPVEPGPMAHFKTILPVFTGTYRGGQWRADTDQLVQGNQGGAGLNTGLAGYGNQFVALGADTTRDYSAILTYRRGRGGVFSPLTPALRLATDRFRPAGAPTLNEAAAGSDVQVDWVQTWPLPDAWTLGLLDGSRGGIAVTLATDDPFMVFDGLAEYAAAFAITINYWS